MKFNKTLLGSVISMALASGISTSVAAKVAVTDGSSTNSAPYATQAKKSVGLYVVQLKGDSAVRHANEIGELTPRDQLVSIGNRYDSQSATMQSYIASMQAQQASVASDIGAIEVIHNYVHTFNGFSAKMTPAQYQLLQQHPDVAGIWEDQAFQPQTSNTPAFLGLTGPDGANLPDYKGEGVIVGILDTGITPENPSFADDLDPDFTYTTPETWSGICDAGVEAGAGEGGEDTFQCNDKLIGARYYNESFASTYELQYVLGEIDSPRDSDGHGSHVAGTAAGNEGVDAIMNGTNIGTMSGVAPRAQIAMYKVCWNSDYVSPENVNERGCFFGDSMAAIDQAVEDGVDVLNYSIGNSTDLTTPVYRAALDAEIANVVFAAAAGNSGPAAATTSNTAPWVTTVAASTYDGISATKVMQVTNRDPAEDINFVEGIITAPLVETGDVSGELVIAEPLLGCFEGGDDGEATPLDNAAEIAGKVAFISRGTCAFSQKVARAQESGASAVVIYTTPTSPVTGLGGNGSFDIPGGMINNADGEALKAAIEGGEAVTVALSAGLFADQVEVGNVMASFSGRGFNPSTGDITKPDITAPGVRILAATSSTPMFEPHGAQVKYLNGTSMASPHIAGMAALLMGKNPGWSPAQVKSALMTTARQDVVKEDGLTPADPFDFGAGHAQPVTALDPGLTYDADYLDYMAFMCGHGEADFVAAQTGFSCAAFEGAGYDTDPSQLNYPSIAIGELLEAPETIFRVVTNMTDAEATYSISVEAPAGVEVESHTFDQDGAETAEETLVVPANGRAAYALTFTKTEAAVLNEWVHGSVTLTDATHTVRSPISVLPSPDIAIDAPAQAAIGMNSSGRATMPVQMNYTGTTSMDYAGFVAPVTLSGVVGQDPDSTYNPGEPELVSFDVTVPDGAKLVRFNLTNANVAAPGTDLDLFLYRCEGDACGFVAQATRFGSDEDITLVNPLPGEYRLDVHGWDTGADAEVGFDLSNWVAAGPEATTRMSMSRRAIKGRFNRVSIRTNGLASGVEHMGAITFYDGEGEAVQTTVLSTTPE